MSLLACYKVVHISEPHLVGTHYCCNCSIYEYNYNVFPASIPVSKFIRGNIQRVDIHDNIITYV